MYLPEAAQIESFLKREVQKHFPQKLVDTKERIRLIADLYKYRLEDPYFHAQAKGKIPKHYSVYFDDEFVCDFDSTYLPEAVMLLFWRGLTKLFKEGKIQFDKRMYKVEEEVEAYRKNKEEEDKLAKINKLDIPEEAKATIRALNAKKGKKKKK